MIQRIRGCFFYLSVLVGTNFQFVSSRFVTYDDNVLVHHNALIVHICDAAFYHHLQCIVPCCVRYRIISTFLAESTVPTPTVNAVLGTLVQRRCRRNVS